MRGARGFKKDPGKRGSILWERELSKRMQRELKCDRNKTHWMKTIFTNSDLNEISQNLCVWPEPHKSFEQVWRTRAGTGTDQSLWLPWRLRQKRVCLQRGRCRFDSWAGKIPLETGMATPQYYCPVNSMYRGAWRAIVHGIAKSRK